MDGFRAPVARRTESTTRRIPAQSVRLLAGGVYDENGNLAYRVDLFEAAHGGVETPHWQPYQVNVNPKTGKTYVNPTGDAFPGVGPAGEPPFGC